MYIYMFNLEADLYSHLPQTNFLRRRPTKISLSPKVVFVSSFLLQNLIPLFFKIDPKSPSLYSSSHLPLPSLSSPPTTIFDPATTYTHLRPSHHIYTIIFDLAIPDPDTYIHTHNTSPPFSLSYIYIHHHHHKSE
ncbi:hypothetical protein LguiA_003064 [Lonicera macranthoides]